MNDHTACSDLYCTAPICLHCYGLVCALVCSLACPLGQGRAPSGILVCGVRYAQFCSLVWSAPSPACRVWAARRPAGWSVVCGLVSGLVCSLTCLSGLGRAPAGGLVCGACMSRTTSGRPPDWRSAAQLSALEDMLSSALVISSPSAVCSRCSSDSDSSETSPRSAPPADRCPAAGGSGPPDA